MNRLATESSPYLLQHAHNPVDWYPWGDEALHRARVEDRPILVSIGYSACHWCHVMERESFEDPETARLMNAHFINIKIDREERPDLDHLYMDAVQAMSGSGGWPLNVFLTPEGKPFYGGTYFPPRRVHNRPSWKEVLHGLSSAFQEKRTEIEEQATELTQHLEKSNAFGITASLDLVPSASQFTRQQVDMAFQQIMGQADRQWGGFGQAPKFPQTFTIRFLLRYHHVTGNAEAREQALLSLDKMIMGGIYDHVGGGFARYSTDTEWLAPHFEKMLYDNALLVQLLCEAWQLTGFERYRRAIDETLSFTSRELMSPDGLFYSALDADSEGVEGKFYTWSEEEVRSILEKKLDKETASLFCRVYDITPNGNWEHTNIPRLKEWPDPEQEVRLKECLDVLFQERSARIRPGLDNKLLLGWNALMNKAFSMAGLVLDVPVYRDVAQRNMASLLQVFERSEGQFAHVARFMQDKGKSGEARISAFLDDLTSLAHALLQLYEYSGREEYLRKAEAIAEQLLQRFSDEENIFFYYTPVDQKDVLVRKKEIYDGATPSGNSLAAALLWRLGLYLDREDWRMRSLKMLDAVQQMASKYPLSFGIWSDLLQELAAGTSEIAIFGDRSAEARNSLLRTYLPYRVIQSSATENEEFALLRGRKPIPGKIVYFLCRNYACAAPVYAQNDLLRQLRETTL